MSFEEKSVWVQLGAMVLVLGVYFAIAGRMMASGIDKLPSYAGLFVGSVVMMVIVLVAGHIAIAVVRKPETRDERDRLIEWRAEAFSSWVVGAGVITGITGMVLGLSNVWVAHLLLGSMFVSEVLKYTLQLVSYRRGM